jgi:uncharacterized protein YbbC (DUF1343 family)
MPSALRTGLDRLLTHDPRSYGRIGWLVTGSAVTSDDLVWAPVAAEAAGFTNTRLFAPEHGAHGALPEAMAVLDHRDPWTGLPVCSMYGHDDAAAAIAEALDHCDTVVIDLPDNGTRYSTYLATVADLIAAIAAHPKPPRLIVADRPNLLGRRVAGPPLMPGFESIVGRTHVPARHGLSLGELVRRYLAESGHDIAFDVVTVEGWDPRHTIENGVYLPPSPNLNCFAAQLLYTGTCLFEGTNVSEGRGTANPFQVIGAPWLDGQALASQLRADGWQGVGFRAVSFVPSTSKHKGELCEGVFLHLRDSGEIRPIEIAVRMLELVFAQSERTLPRHAAGTDAGPARFLDRLWGNSDLADHLEARATRRFEVPAIPDALPEVEAAKLYPH